jgi:hypothetical protein
MDRLLNSVLRPRGGASLQSSATPGFCGPGNCRILCEKRESIPGLPTTFSAPIPQDIVVGNLMATKSSKGEWAKQETFLSLFFAGDSGACKPFLLKN